MCWERATPVAHILMKRYASGVMRSQQRSLVAQRLDGIEAGGLAGRVVAEENADHGGKKEIRP
jgi:hypothetical protein